MHKLLVLAAPVDVDVLQGMHSGGEGLGQQHGIVVPAVVLNRQPGKPAAQQHKVAFVPVTINAPQPATSIDDHVLLARFLQSCGEYQRPEKHMTITLCHFSSAATLPPAPHCTWSGW